ncbi:hypothetical protein GCM10027169_12240 [Gordonia jinhuaensis]|uniref:DUF4190 domain-containing protein n=1 Tax=Gordonia jinhuaensis TaxID=1517702 RepID=A0A916T4K1_9ACTN|nr:hypothetical protein GCM10011489_20180 [Gordonia jinhuaensis]
MSNRSGQSRSEATGTRTSGTDSSTTHSDSNTDSGATTKTTPSRTNRLAIIALVLSFLGITSIFGVIAAYVARSQIRRTKEQGWSLTTAALWIGWIYIGAAVLCLVGYIWIVA